MSLTIRSSSPKAPEALPHRSTLVQALSQPAQRVRKHTCVRACVSAAAVTVCFCAPDAEPRVVAVRRRGVGPPRIHQGQSETACDRTCHMDLLLEITFLR